MMQGVEILAQEPIMQYDDNGLIVFLVGLGVALIAGIIVGICTYDGQLGVLVGVIIVLLSVISGVITDAASEHPTGKYKYKVTISDDVSMNEFLEKYEIVDQEGKIMTIKEKDDAND